MSVFQKAEFSPLGWNTVEQSWRSLREQTRGCRSVDSEMPRMLEIHNLRVPESKNPKTQNVLRGRQPSTLTCQCGWGDPREKASNEGWCPQWSDRGPTWKATRASEPATKAPRSCESHLVDPEAEAGGREGHPRLYSTPYSHGAMIQASHSSAQLPGVGGRCCRRKLQQMVPGGPTTRARPYTLYSHVFFQPHKTHFTDEETEA